MLPKQMQQEKYHYFRTKDQRRIQFWSACGNEKNVTSNVSQFIEALTFICCKWRGQRNPKPEPIGIFQAGEGQVVARCVCATPRLC